MHYERDYNTLANLVVAACKDVYTPADGADGNPEMDFLEEGLQVLHDAAIVGEDINHAAWHLYWALAEHPEEAESAKELRLEGVRERMADDDA